MNDQIETQVIDDEDNTPGDAKSAIRQAREMVPVGNTGVQITDLAQQVDYAQTMARARNAIPAHLKENVGDCLAIIDISSRCGLSPYMVANKTYVQNNRLCFESQLFHAFAQASGLLRGDLAVDYEGEGEDRVCIVTGYLRADPAKPRVHRSQPLNVARPKRNEHGAVKGSPLWDKKPDVQLFYDTSRDWVRMFAPRATLGIYTPDEIEEYGPDFARDVTPTSGLHDRLKASGVSRDEGFKEGQAATEIAKAGGKEKLPRTKRNKDWPEPEPEGKIDAALPKNPKEWAVYCSTWIKATDSAEAIRARWASEKQLRNSVGVIEDDRKPVQTFMEEQCKELGE